MGDIIGKSVGCSDFHFIRDAGGMHIESSPEDAREGERVVDLVGVLAPPCPDNSSAGHKGIVGQDLRYRVSKREYDRIRVHGPDHRLSDDCRDGYTDADIGTFHGIFECAKPPLAVGLICDDELVLVGVQSFAVAEDNPFRVADNDIVHAAADVRVIPDTAEHPGDGVSRSPCPAHHDIEVFEPFAGHPAGIYQGSEHHNSCPVLVVVHHRDTDSL